jgi:DNA-nicking Smr family endonuclease
MSRRRRELSESEKALWQQVARTVKPLDTLRAPVADLPAATQADIMDKPGHAMRPVHRQAPPKPAASLPLSGLDRRTNTRLRRGRIEINARLDLHGHTQDAAYGALRVFLSRACYDGAGFVLVITGKSGVLNRMVPQWLREAEFRLLISGFHEASPRHGGRGALYIRLRRKTRAGLHF